MSIDGNQEHLVLLARLGEKLVNHIVAGRILCHDTVAGQAPYIHSDDPALAVTSAFGRGRLDDAAEALAIYLADPRDVVQRIAEEETTRQQLKDALDHMVDRFAKRTT